MKNGLLIIILFLFFSNCERNKFESNSIDQATGDVKFKLIDTLYVALDSVTPTITNHIEIYPKDKPSQIVTVNALNNALNFYDIKTGSQENTLLLENSGPNYIGSLESFTILNKDSILVLSQGLYAGFYNWSGSLIGKFNKVDPEIRLSPITTTGNPPVYAEGKLYQSGFFMGSDDHDIKLVCNTDDSGCYTDFKIPSFYEEGWGPSDYDIHYHCYNSSNQRFTYSFPPYENLISTDHKGQIREDFAGSKYFGKINPPRKFAGIGRDARIKQTLIRPIFQEIIHDQYRKLYYRIAEHPLNESEVDFVEDAYAPGIRDFSIVILDNDLQRIGESQVLKKGLYDTRIFYVSPEGLFLNSINNSRENIMIFHCLIPEL